MSLERFLALIFPYKFQSLPREARSIVIMICIWVVSAFLSSGHLMAGRPSKRFYPDSWCFVNFESQDATDRGFSYLYVSVGLLVLITTFVTNINMLGRLSGTFKGTQKFELLGIEMATTNSIIGFT
ncbi:prostaglandin E2 receptor EP4 subtype-like [Saccostrea cucullata]|uniref:prostaglandin E2 receptor EP4 subtype-like n=1 Tax=Saccostrea cuccullata TaxID=36930 RepID=UPI002ED68AA6